MKKFITFLLISMALFSGNSFADANTDFQSAVKSGNLGKAITALNAGATNVNALDDSGQTALHYAVAKGNLEAVTALAKKDARVDIPDTHYKRTVVDLAIFQMCEIGNGLFKKPTEPLLQQSAVIYAQILYIIQELQKKQSKNLKK